MSAMLGRTWNYITAAVSPDSSSAIKWTPPKDLSVPGGDLPKGLASFLKSLVTQPDVERIIEDNIVLVKAKLEEPGVRDSAVADCLLRMTVADLHGFNVEFARVHALKLAQKGETLSLKKIGYLTSVALLKESQDPLNLLLVNTIIKDLSSKNPIEINFALCASASHLIPEDVVPLLLPSLISKTTHIKDFIRKKALASLHSLLKRNPELASSIEGPTRRCLMDQNPGVVGIALQVTKELVGRVDVVDILPGVLDVADQIIEDKFSNEYKYKGLTAPWMLIDALSLGSSIIQSVEGVDKISPEINERYFQLLRRILSKSSGSKEIISYATTFECIRAIHTLRNADQKSELFSKALQAVSKFLQDKSSNLKYIGIASMELLFTNTDLVLTAEQEQIISNCLNYPDESIRRKTLSLMYVLANENNVRQICSRLLSYIKESDDKYKRKEFLEKASGLADKFKQSQGMDWYINVLLRLSQVSPSEMKYNFLYRIKSALGAQSSDPSEQSKVGSKLKSILSRFLFGDEVKVSKSMTSLYIWCWSHFETEFEDFPSILDAAKKADTEESVLDALSYIFTHNPSVHFSDNIRTYISNSSKHPNERIRDKARELDFMIQLLIKESLPEIASSSNDFTLAYCDEFICEQSKIRELLPYRNKCSLLLSVIISEEGEGDDDKSKLRLTSYNELPSPASSSKNSSSQLKDIILPSNEAPVWSFSGCNKERNSLTNKLSDSLESFFVEEKHQNFGLESLSKDDFSMAEEEE